MGLTWARDATCAYVMSLFRGPWLRMSFVVLVYDPERLHGHRAL